MRSSSAAEARPVRTVLNSFVRRLDRLVHPRASRPRSSRRSRHQLVLLRRRDDRADPLAGDDAADVPAARARRRGSGGGCPCRARARSCPSSSARARSPRVRELGQEARVRVEPRIAVVDALAPRASPSGSPRRRSRARAARRGVGGEERVARAGGEDHDAALLEVADRAAADVRLGDLGDRRAPTGRACRAPWRSSASCRASALRSVASIPA